MRYLVFLALGLGLWAAPADAQSLQLDGEVFNETLRESAEISGALIVGVQVRNKTAASTGIDPKLPAGLPPGTPVCVRVVSANGLYDSENQFNYLPDAPRPPGPQIDLSSSRHKDYLGQLTESEIAAAVSLGPCDDTPEHFLATSWGRADGTKVTLFLNGFQADAVFVRVLDTGETVRCTDAKVEVATAYDTECTLEFSGMAGRKVPLSIERFQNRQPAPATNITIELARP